MLLGLIFSVKQDENKFKTVIEEMEKVPLYILKACLLLNQKPNLEIALLHLTKLDHSLDRIP